MLCVFFDKVQKQVEKLKNIVHFYIKIVKIFLYIVQQKNFYGIIYRNKRRTETYL